MALNIKAGSYTGNGTSQSITGLGFALNSGSNTMLIIKGGANNAQVTTSEMGANKVQNIIGQTLQANKVTSFDADGFTLGNDITTNASGTVYYYLAIYDSTGASFATGTYLGNGTGPRSITGLSFSPNGLFMWDDLGDTGGYRTSDMPTDSYLPWGTSSTLLTDRILSLDASGFTVGFRNEVNGTGRNYYWVAFAATTSLIKNLTYTGNGTSGHAITGMGFQSDFVVTKDGTSANAAAAVSSQETTGNGLLITATAEATGRFSSIDSDGFTLGTSANTNTSSDTYYALGFKNSTSVATVTVAPTHMMMGMGA